jgi:signal recognition particle subunit SRP54
VRSFVSRLLGMGDLSGLVEKMKDTNMGDQTEMIKRMTQGQFSLRDMQEQFKNVLKMGSYVLETIVVRIALGED